MKIVLGQINFTVGDILTNKDKILSAISKAQSNNADMIVFPELAVCGYPPEDLLYKDHFVQECMDAVQDITKHTQNISVILGSVDKKDDNLFNAAFILSNEKRVGVYHKQQLPNYGVFDEKRYFLSGDTSSVFEVGGVKIGVSICEDVWVKGSVCDSQAKQGAEILINLSSSPFDIHKLKEREQVLKAKAQKTQKPIVYVNSIGGQDELVFDGRSFVVDGQGEIIACGKQFEEEELLVDLENTKNEIHCKSLTEMESIYRALVLGTHDYVLKNGFEKVILGLSGGIDSAVVAAIAVKAIGSENVVGVIMPSQFSSKETQSDAQILADRLGIKSITIPIKPAYDVYLDALSDEFKGLEFSEAEENIQARIRGNLIMALSNKFGWLVLTTGNKSEVAVGYCTLYGDMSGGFAVIKDVPKTKVFDLARLINNSGVIIPQDIIDRPPSAELRENQKDQDSLPEYDLLDQILSDYIEKHESIAQMSLKYDTDTVKRIVKLVDQNEYKRRQSALGVKITSRAFGRDWRLPITNKYKEFEL